MLRSLIFSSLFLLISAALFSQNNKLSKEEAAIKKVIEKESAYFWARDYDNWKKTWVHEPYAIWTAATKDGVRQYYGWEAWSAEVQDFFEESPEALPYEGHVSKTNYSFRIYGKGAWVSFVQENEGTRTIETRIMEKQGNKWKIAMVELIFDANKEVGAVEGETTN